MFQVESHLETLTQLTASTKKNFSIEVVTDGKKHSRGGLCKIRCTEGGNPTTTTTTTAVPTTSNTITTTSTTSGKGQLS